MTASPGQSTRRPCDIVMKGGITSGVVYPPAVCELANDFDFRSIGGTSAGAIAAALTAAAQYRRLRGGQGAEAGFEQLKSVPTWLGSNDNLFSLFAPDKPTRSLFTTIIALFVPQSMVSRVMRLLEAYWLEALIGAIPGAMYLWAASMVSSGALVALHVVLAIAVILGGASLAAMLSLANAVFRIVPTNGYGLVKGAVTEEPRQAGRPERTAALSSWLAAEMERVAGLDVGVTPLTFGMLWNPNSDPGALASDDVADDRAINLEMITTCVTQGMPYRFPCSTAGLYFRKEDLDGYFPKHVIQWMLDHPRPGAAQHDGFSVMPAIADLPVIVATRMSLAFPFLLSAVPLHAVDYTATTENRPPQPIWFSDGGICSNFPISLFDAPLPRWPTLAISLGTFTARTPADGVFMPKTNSQGRLRAFASIQGLPSFFGSILSTMQNWNDDEQSKLPGYRDRIATIALHPDEGGLNLRMPASVMSALENRGARAGEELRNHFVQPSDLSITDTAMNWENHRWLRFRTTMAALSHYLRGWDRGFTLPISGDVPYEKLLQSTTGLPVHSYPIPSAQRDSYSHLVDVVANDASGVSQNPVLETGTPQPDPRLVLRTNR
jgi:predicted acylesterase/phospholipase RssA